MSPWQCLNRRDKNKSLFLKSCRTDLRWHRKGRDWGQLNWTPGTEVYSQSKTLKWSFGVWWQQIKFPWAAPWTSLKFLGNAPGILSKPLSQTWRIYGSLKIRVSTSWTGFCRKWTCRSASWSTHSEQKLSESLASTATHYAKASTGAQELNSMQQHEQGGNITWMGC